MRGVARERRRGARGAGRADVPRRHATSTPQQGPVPKEEVPVRRDLDRLMQQRGLAGLVVFANDRYCPAMYYATGRKFHRAVYFRAADGRAHLIADPMERDDAAKTGIEYSTLAQHRWMQRIDTHGPAG